MARTYYASTMKILIPNIISSYSSRENTPIRNCVTTKSALTATMFLVTDRSYFKVSAAFRLKLWATIFKKHTGQI